VTSDLISISRKLPGSLLSRFKFVILLRNTPNGDVFTTTVILKQHKAMYAENQYQDILAWYLALPSW